MYNSTQIHFKPNRNFQVKSNKKAKAAIKNVRTNSIEKAGRESNYSVYSTKQGTLDGTES
jgi:hypothetical protein